MSRAFKLAAIAAHKAEQDQMKQALAEQSQRLAESAARVREELAKAAQGADPTGGDAVLAAKKDFDAMMALAAEGLIKRIKSPPVLKTQHPMDVISYHKQDRIGYPSDDSTTIILNYARAINLNDEQSRVARNKMNNHDSSKIEVNKKSKQNFPLDKDEILEVITALSSDKCPRILNTKSHLIGDLVAASSGQLSAEDVKVIESTLSSTLLAAGIDNPSKSKSMQIMRKCIDGKEAVIDAAAKEKADRDGVAVLGAGGGGGGGGLAAALAEARGVVGAGVAAVAGGVVAEAGQEDKKSWADMVGKGSSRGGGDAGRS